MINEDMKEAAARARMAAATRRRQLHYSARMAIHSALDSAKHIAISTLELLPDPAGRLMVVSVALDLDTGRAEAAADTRPKRPAPTEPIPQPPPSIRSDCH